MSKQSRQAAKRASKSIEFKPDINTAGKEELLQVPGITEELAEAIINQRPYNSVDDLNHIPQIGEWSLEYIKEALKIPGTAESKTKGV